MDGWAPTVAAWQQRVQRHSIGCHNYQVERFGDSTGVLQNFQFRYFLSRNERQLR